MRSRAVTLAVLVLAGCASSYADRGPISFEALPYAGPQGNTWPEHEALLGKAGERYGLGKPLEVGYVDVNPEAPRTLVLLHGLGSYLKFWRYQIDPLAAAGWRVIAVDLPGYGKSAKPASFPYTMEAFGDVVLELLDAIGVDKPVLIGHSMGGHIGLSIAIRHPEALRALALISPAGFEKFSRADRRWLTDNFSTTLVASVPEEGIWGNIRRNNFARWSAEYEWLIEERVRLAQNDDFPAYAYANVRSVQGLAHTDFVRDNLEAIQIPVLIVHGDSDRLIPNPFLHGGTTTEIMAWGHGKIRGSTLITLPGCGHTTQIDCRDETNRELAAFLARL
jgi:pimeloyl-ACP methyl ester carboxylesterase